MLTFSISKNSLSEKGGKLRLNVFKGSPNNGLYQDGMAVCEVLCVKARTLKCHKCHEVSEQKKTA